MGHRYYPSAGQRGQASRAVFCCGLICGAAAGCSGNAILFGTLPATEDVPGSVDLAVAVVRPSKATTAAPGAQALVQWADIATLPGTAVRVSAQRQNALHENVGDPIWLVGDGTVGSGRDALADGDSDVFIWDITGVRVGDYVITATIDSPDGRSETAVSRDEKRGTTGVLTVVTGLPVPTFTFTAPGGADVTLHPGDTFNITWTDNGVANADALLRLGLDTDADHTSGNEIILFRDEPLSTNGNTGQFTFALVDENGDTVPDGTYRVFAIVDDNANDPVTAEATGHLIIAP